MNNNFLDPIPYTLYPASGAFESIRSYDGKIFCLDEHVKRLYDSCRSLSIKIDSSPLKIKNMVKDVLTKSKIKNAYIRISAQSDGKIDVIVKEFKPYPENYFKNGVKVMTVPEARNIHTALDPKIKSSDFLNGILAKISTQKDDIFEAIILNSDGFVAECTVSNIFMVKDKKLFTPAPYSGILEGVTRKVVLDLAKKSGIKTQQTIFTRHDLYNADEVFLTNTSVEIMPVVEIDKRAISGARPGEITKKLSDKFKMEVK